VLPLSGKRPDVLLDLTILATDTRERGIGRYLMELAPQLEREAKLQGRIRLAFLRRTAWLGTGEVCESAEQAIQELVSNPEPAKRGELAYRSRIGTARAVQASGARLLHLGYPNVTPLGSGARPRVVTCHDLIPLQFPEHYTNWKHGYTPGRRALDARRYAGAQHIIAISRATADVLMQKLGVAASKISVVYNGVSLERWSAEPSLADASVRERYELQGKSLLVFAGDGDFRKNAEGMLGALGILRREKPSMDFTLAWAGRLRDEQKARLQQTASALGATGALRLLGYVPDADLAALYRQAHATLFVSRAEGFGYPVLEAMACGSAVVTSNVSSLSEIAGDVALAVDPEDHPAIAEAILSIDTSGSAREARVTRGRNWASQFSTQRQARETLAVYEQLLR